MSDISLHALGEHQKAVADVIFIHGLGGDSRGTWTSLDNSQSYWPKWIYEEFSQTNTPCSVWMLDYPAAATSWTGRGNAMALPDRAANAMQYLANLGIGKKPIIFVAHSLGGLLTKYILKNGSTSAESTHRELAQRTCAVVFMATPHRGANLASLLKGLRIARPTVAIEDLQAHNPYLNEVDTWYRDNVERLRIRTFALRENKKMTPRFLKYLPGPDFWVVDPTSADPNIVGSPVIPIDANHFEICKPSDRAAAIYVNVKAFLSQSLNDSEVTQRATDQDLIRFLAGIAREHEQCYCVISSFESATTQYRPHLVNDVREFAGPTVSPEDATAAVYLCSLVSGVRNFSKLSLRTGGRLSDDDRSNHLILIGSSFTNPQTDWALSADPARHKFLLEGNTFAITCQCSGDERDNRKCWLPNDGDQSVEPNSAPGKPTRIDYAMVQRLKWDKYDIFVLAGLGPVGTQGAAYYLYQNWYHLYKAYADRPFAIILRFGSRTQRAAFNDATVVHGSDPEHPDQCTASPLQKS